MNLSEYHEILKREAIKYYGASNETDNEIMKKIYEAKQEAFTFSYNLLTDYIYN
jgi:aryl-alcohol dehydrogenase-like predicted oxidoreductase